LSTTQKPAFEQHKNTRQAIKPPASLAALAALAGVRFNGVQPWDIQVYDPAFYQRLLTQGSLGFGEAYMDGLWNCHAMDELFSRLMSQDIDEKIKGWTRIRLFGEVLRNKLFNLQNSTRAYQVGEQHYDIGNDVFEAMLDPTMSYSCAYWQHANNLEQAQQHKLDLICRKLELKPGEHLLEIGCGWGGLAQFAASNYGVKVTGITISVEQRKLAKQRCQNLPVDILLMDYRKLQGRFDKIVSVGMFEHVGAKNYAEFFDTAYRLMRREGIFLLHTIGIYKTMPYVDRWIDKYIFPNGKLPSALELSRTLEQRFLIEDWHNFGTDYDRTLMAWWQNFDRKWPQLKQKYDNRFYRMWRYYLMSCAGFFRSRKGQLWQLVLSKKSRRAVYRSVR
jgi:cyclopropane-fatty-acyl-phospholipid synthase